MRVSVAVLSLWGFLSSQEFVNGFGVSRDPSTCSSFLSQSTTPGSQSRTSLAASGDGEAASGDGEASSDKNAEEVIKPIILQAFLPAADPMYKCRGEIGKGEFVVSREGGPKAEELTDENMLRIVKSQSTDLEVNTLVWKCLGYRFDVANECWNPDEVFPNWKKKFESPPDLIGMQRIYEKDIDRASLKSNQALVKSVPVESKQSLKKFLKPLGWNGYKYKELTPNLTRRAQCANWLLFYREELFGYTLEELKERKRQKLEAQAKEEKRIEEETGKSVEKGWTPPVKEVF